MDYSLLVNEISLDPNGYGFADFVTNGDDGRIAIELNKIRDEILVDQLVPLADVKIILIEAPTGDYLKLKISTEPLAITAYDYINNKSFENVDLKRPAVQGMLDGLVSLTIMSEDTKTKIMDLGKRKGSRAEQLGLGYVSPEDVAKSFGRGN